MERKYFFVAAVTLLVIFIVVAFVASQGGAGTAGALVTRNTGANTVQKPVVTAPDFAAMKKPQLKYKGKGAAVSDENCTLLGGTMVYLPLAAGWNMFSIPGMGLVSGLGTNFPSSLVGWYSPFYYYDPITRSYGIRTLPLAHEGYWFAVNVTQNASACVYCCLNGTDFYANLAPGWNLIGSPCEPVAWSAINQAPAGVVIGTPYGWDPYSGSYFLATTLVPGQAYWVVATAGGTLTHPC